MCSCRSICRWLPVCFVCLLIGWCYFEYTYDILIPMLDPALENTPHGSHEQGVAYMITFNIIFGIAVLAFAGAIFVDPGRIPDTWIVGNEDSESGPFFPEQTTVEIKKELTAEGRGQRRICRKSKPQVYKPDRSHYCKMLSRCVLKMDHFCPWLNNCIGFYNHKYFFLFIFYMAVLTIFMIVSMSPVFVYDVTSMDDASIDFTTEFRVTLTYLVLCLLCIGLVCFCGFHFHLLLLNYTTIEFLEKRGCYPEHDYINPYHLGYYGNICSVMGNNPLFWLLPVRWGCEGDGLSFNLNPDWFPSAKVPPSSRP